MDDRQYRGFFPDSFNDDAEDLTLSLERSEIAAEERRLLMAAEAYLLRKTHLASTHRFDGDIAALIPLPSLAAALCNSRRPAARSYQLMPPRPADRRPDGVFWRIELHGIETSAISMGLDVGGDTVLGRGRDPEALPDVDLDPLGAANLGVSRRHALLRPSRYQLYLIDLESTNGTRCNGVLLGGGLVHVVANNDTISLGTLTLQVKIISVPETARAERPPAEPPAPLNPFA
jgi:hypothetical protein